MEILTQQEYLAMCEGAEVLEADRVGEKVLRLVDGTMVKLFRRKRLITSTAFYPYAQRFANNAQALEKRGIPVPKVIAVARVEGLARDMVRYVPLAGKTLREMDSEGLSPERKQLLRDSLTHFVIALHDQGIYFRSLHIGNVVLTPEGKLGLIDFSDLRIYPWKLGAYLRGRNMRRMQGIEREKSWLDLDAIIAGKAPSLGGIQ